MKPTNPLSINPSATLSRPAPWTTLPNSLSHCASSGTHRQAAMGLLGIFAALVLGTILLTMVLPPVFAILQASLESLFSQLAYFLDRLADPRSWVYPL